MRDRTEVLTSRRALDQSVRTLNVAHVSTEKMESGCHISRGGGVVFLAGLINRKPRWFDSSPRHQTQTGSHLSLRLWTHSFKNTDCAVDGRVRCCGGEVTQRSAKPPTPVRFWTAPPECDIIFISILANRHQRRGRLGREQLTKALSLFVASHVTGRIPS